MPTPVDGRRTGSDLRRVRTVLVATVAFLALAVSHVCAPPAGARTLAAAATTGPAAPVDVASTGATPAPAGPPDTVAVPAVGPRAAAAGKPGGLLTVMTQNLYLGGDPQPSLDVTDSRYPGYPRMMVSAMFPTRAAWIAAAVKEHRPDLIGLQEVSQWTFTRATPGPDLVGIDFLRVLRAALRDEGLRYAVATVSDNGAIGPFPYLDPARNCVAVGDCTVSVRDRDAILVNRDTPGLSVVRDTARSRSFTGPAPRRVDGITKTYRRGWSVVDLVLDRVPLRFATTHLEFGGLPRRQQAQAWQYLRALRSGAHTVIATGDINSDAYGTGTGTYSRLTRHYFRDMWDGGRDGWGMTCCQGNSLTNRLSRASARIDVVLAHGEVTSRRAAVVHAEPYPVTGPGPIWASDHAGVVATVIVRAPRPPVSRRPNRSR